MKTLNYTITFYRDKKREYRSRITAPNGRILFDSGEGYKRKQSAVSAFNSLIDAIFTDRVVQKTVL